MKKQFIVSFQYDKRGEGNLEIRDGEKIVFSSYTRTGSRDKEGILLNAIPEGQWRIMDNPVPTDEPGMRIADNKGEKVRLYNHAGGWTHYNVHYDESLNGTKGCPGIQNPADTITFMNWIRKILKKQDLILVFINKNLPVFDPEVKEEPVKIIQTKTVKSKTFWVGLAGVVAGIGLCVTGEVEKGVGAILAGLAAISGRDAISKLQQRIG